MRTLRLKEMKSLSQAEKWQSHDLKPGLSGFLITALPGICHGLFCCAWHMEGIQGRVLNCFEDKCKVLVGQDIRRPKKKKKKILESLK